MLESHATSPPISIAIPHGHQGLQPNYTFDIPVWNGHPIAILQASKHLLKTFRNNLTSGARLLTFPTGTAMYGQLEKLAFAEDSPVYKRDIINTDRQDDNAATRLFSGSTLQWLGKHQADQQGLIVYLFVAGELCDASQNRSLPIIQRIQLGSTEPNPYPTLHKPGPILMLRQWFFSVFFLFPGRIMFIVLSSKFFNE